MDKYRGEDYYYCSNYDGDDHGSGDDDDDHGSDDDISSSELTERIRELVVWLMQTIDGYDYMFYDEKTSPKQQQQ